MANPRPLTPAELVAEGLAPAGPLAPAMTSQDAEKNMQAIREFVNPSYMTPINPIKVLGKLHSAAGTGLGYVASALGGLNLGSGVMSPEQKALRSQQLGNQLRDMGEAVMLPVASAGRVIGPMAQEARPLFTAFLTRLAQQGTLAGTQKAMEGQGAETIFQHAALGTALQGVLEAPGAIIRTMMSSKAGQKILAEGAASFQKSLQSFQERQRFDSEFVGELNELRAQGFKEQAAKTSAEYGLKAYNHKIEGQKMVADWEKAVTAQDVAKELARTAHSERVAQNITTVWDKRVPAWQGLPNTVEGLIERVYGKGSELLSRSFDKSLKEVIAKAQGRQVTMNAADADALGLSLQGGAPTGTPAGRIDPGAVNLPSKEMARVDAAELAQAVLGKKSQIDPELYHSAAEVLIKNGLGNSAANAEYASGMALRKYMDKTQALEFIDQPKLYVEKLLKGLTKEPVLKQLQGRIPEEDALRGAVAGARDLLPKALQDIPKPVQSPLAPAPAKAVSPLPMKTDPQLDPSQAPVEPTPADLGVRVGEGPTAQKLGALGGLLGAGIGGQTGGGYGHYGVGGVTGTAAGLLLSKLLSGPTYRGPISAQAEQLLARAPTAATGILRAIFGGGALSPDQQTQPDPDLVEPH